MISAGRTVVPIRYLGRASEGFEIFYQDIFKRDLLSAPGKSPAEVHKLGRRFLGRLHSFLP